MEEADFPVTGGIWTTSDRWDGEKSYATWVQ